MAEYIGTTISLISKSDIRYVGKLHEINQENSTVALENVRSHGTEGRKQNPEEEIPPSDSVYEYIVFRGSDVKDLRIEEEKPKESVQPQIPNDPAILGAGARRPPPSQSGPADRQAPRQGVSSPQQGGPAGPPFGQQHPQYPPFYPPPPGNWGRGGPPHGFPPMPYGAPPPGWFPPPGQGFPQHGGPFPPYGYPPGPPGQFPPQGPPGQQNQGQKPTPIGPGGKQQTPGGAQPPIESKETKKPSDSAAEKTASSQSEPQSKPVGAKSETEQITPSATTTGPDANANKPRVQPALPLQSPAANKTTPQPRSGNAAPTSQTSGLLPTSLRDATQAASAAVAAAMAKLPGAQTNGNAVDNLTKKIDGLRTTDPIRAPRQPGSGGHGFNQARGGRGGRGGTRSAIVPKEVPVEDFDFESANAKFNKEDLVKEAIAGSPLTETAPDATSPGENLAPSYNKASSFFDNISSDAKDRAEGSSSDRPGGREFRSAEHKKNVETFGQGNVDNGYRGGYRGRGRGRGRGGFRGRGYNGGGYRGGYRGDRNDAQAAGQ